MLRLCALLLFLAALPANAHYHILLPDNHSIKKGEKVVIAYQFGHPFECELFDTAKPVRAVAFQPDGKSVDLLPSMTKIEGVTAGNKKVNSYQLIFQPSERGDFTIVVESPPIWMADEKHFIRDVCQVYIHVEAQKGWENAHIDAKEFGIKPMTRPYGLRAGAVYQARVLPSDGVTLHMVEVERFNPTPPKALPPDEYITAALLTDQNGVATCTLPEPGWWAITAIHKLRPTQEPATKDHDGKPYPIVERATLWLPVDDKIPLKPVE